jgi:hypothetical protein
MDETTKYETMTICLLSMDKDEDITTILDAQRNG